MAAGICIVGLGPGSPDLLTREAWDVLNATKEIRVRTSRHPTVEALPGLPWVSFDELYERSEDFSSVYREIAEEILRLGSRPEGVVYAVPGNPRVGETAVVEISRRAAEAGTPVRMVQGLSFLEPVLEALGLDALDGLAVHDAIELAGRHHPPFPPSAHAIIGQLYSADLAGDVKLVLMNQYPEEHEVRLVHAAGTPAMRVETVPLHAIDRSRLTAHLTALYIPPMAASAFEDFQETIAHLRAPEGCPWDREQTHQSIRGNLLEETYEVLQALDQDDPRKIREELGDLLLQILLHAQIATEAGEFRMADVVAGIERKIRRRHPHVFGDVQVDGVKQVLQNWEQIKADERKDQPAAEKGIFDGVPAALPALEQAESLQKRAARVGFDWPDIGGVKAKLQEELGELEGASDDAERESELGDVLFAVVNIARWMHIDAESALRESNIRFRGRFLKMEAEITATGKTMQTLSLPEWDALWEKAKGK